MLTQLSTTGRMIASTSTPVDDLLAREDLGLLLREHSRESSQHKHILGYIEKNLPRIMAAIQKQSSTATQITNAGELLVQFILEDERLDTIRKVVPPTLGTLAKKGVVSPCTALALQHVLINAFDKNFKGTVTAISITLSDEIVHGAIRNLACSATISGTLVALFGAALPTSTMLSPSTVPQMFTAGWLRWGFPLHLVQYVTVAMSTPDCKPYFGFMSEVLKRSFNQGGGPLVDEIMSPQPMGELVAAIVQAATCSDGGPQNFPLAGDGVALLTIVVNVVKRSLIPTQNGASYRAPILQQCAPLRHILEHSVGAVLVQLLDNDGVVSGTLRPTQLGSLRVAICEMYVEVVLLHLRQADEALLAIDFFSALFRTVQRFPNNDSIVRVVEKIFLALVSQRAVAATDGRTDRFIEEDLLWRYFMRPPSSLDTIQTSDTVEAATAIQPTCLACRLLRQWATSAVLANTTLQACSISLAVKLAEALAALLAGANGRPAPAPIAETVPNPFQQIVEDAVIAERLYIWNTPITGKAFGEKGSGCPSATIFHRPLRNPTNISLEISGDESAGGVEDVLPPRMPPVAAVTVVAEPEAALAHDRGSRYMSRFDFEPTAAPADGGHLHAVEADPGFSSFTDFCDVDAAQPTAAAISPECTHPTSTAANHLFFDDDDVNLDDQDDELVVQRRLSASADVDDDDAPWVTQTILDVSNALDGAASAGVAASSHVIEFPSAVDREDGSGFTELQIDDLRDA
jgi:hypothetical protein